MKLITGDCLEKLKDMKDNSVDSIVSDPPYGISFMGKKWDYDVPQVEVWAECLRVLKPGGHALIACGTRTQHRMAVNIEDAGFEIRDIVAWVYGCLSEDTEILTINGWERYHKDIVNNPVVCYNVDKNSFEFHKPIRDFIYENKHTAYRIQSNNTDQIVSRNHRVLVEREGKLIFQRAEKLQSKENIPFLESLSDLPEAIYGDYQRAGSEKQRLQRMCQGQKWEKWNKGKRQKKIICPVCKKEFYPTGQSKGKPRKYCSEQCNGKERAKTLIKYSGNGKGKKRPGTGLSGKKTQLGRVV